MEMKGNEEKIIGLQVLRAIAFLGIFFRHSSGYFLSVAALGVSIFFVMSGYLMVYTYGNHMFDSSLKNNLKFSLGKIKKLYPLHIVTMICVILLNLETLIHSGAALKSYFFLVGKIVLNITLLQTWIPNTGISCSLNGVAWYLSVAMFLYFVFPFIQNEIKSRSSKKLALICIVILIIEILICIPIMLKFGIDSSVYAWFMYCFPVFRLGDFFVGCCLGKIYSTKKDKVNKLEKGSKLKYSIIETLSIILTIVVCVWVEQDGKGVFDRATKNWTTLFIPLSVIWVCLFTLSRGIISNLLCNRFFIYLGNISAYIFLIHYVVVQYFSAALSLLNVEVNGGEKVCLVAVELILTIVFFELYIRIERKVKSRHRQPNAPVA